MTQQPPPGPPPSWNPDQQPTPPQPTPQPARTGLPRWFAPVVAGAAIAIVALLAVLVVVLTTGGGDDSDTTATDTASTSTSTSTDDGTTEEDPADGFEAYGHIRLTDSNIAREPGGFCAGQDGYDDIQAGAQVIIRNSSSQTIAVGNLGNGTKPNDETYASVLCDFYFTIPDVPVQPDDIYSVEVAGRGEINFVQSQADTLELTLGGS